MKSIGAKCGHVKRRLNQGQPLDGKTLEFALSIVDDSDDDLIKGIARKLEAGEKLNDYEHHIMVDVLFVHVRLAS